MDDLTFDVPAGYHEPGSEALSGHIAEHEPAWMYYGHVHQPKVAELLVENTRVVNVGSYYPPTGKACEHEL